MELPLASLPILTIGSAVRDVFLTSPEFRVIPSSQSPSGFAECVSLGAKIDVEDCVFSTGGGATNAAVTFSRLGYPVHVLAKIGDDEAGRSILADLHTHHVSSDHILIDKKGKTGYSTLLTTSNGERTVLVFRGVSGSWYEKDISHAYFENIRALYVSSLGGNIAVLEKIVSLARKKRIPLAMNPGGAELQKASLLLPLLSDAVLILNKEEARALTAKHTADIPTLAATLRRSCSLVVITDGVHGSYAHDATTLWFARPPRVSSLSQTGAGDAFGSAFFAAHLRGHTTAESLQIATLNAASVVQHFGAKAGILRSWPSTALRSKVFVSPRT